MDQDIKKRIKESRGCQLAAKAPPIKTQPWPKTDIPWTRVHIDYAGPLNEYYHLIIINSFLSGRQFTNSDTLHLWTLSKQWTKYLAALGLQRYWSMTMVQCLRVKNLKITAHHWP